MRTPPSILSLCLALALLPSGCRRSETTPAPAPKPADIQIPQAAAPLRVITVDLGNAIDAGRRVAAPTTTFAPGDTIFASVATEGGSPGATITARWTYEDGQLVNEQQQALASTGAAVTEFHIAKPDGWPAGRYRVEISAAGQPLAARDFEVRGAAGR